MAYFEERIQQIKEAGIAAPFFKNVVSETSRHGRKSYYYRVGKGKRVRLPDLERVGPDAFSKAYKEAANGMIAPEKAPRRAILAAGFPQIGDPGYVYFAKAGDEVKIGFTKDMRSRVKAIQTSCAKPVKVLAVIPGSRGTEAFFHDRFADNRVGGEWFSLTGLLAEFLNVRIGQ